MFNILKISISPTLWLKWLKNMSLVPRSMEWQNPGNRPTLTSTSIMTPPKSLTPWGKRASLRVCGPLESKHAVSVCGWKKNNGTHFCWFKVAFIIVSIELVSIIVYHMIWAGSITNILIFLLLLCSGLGNLLPALTSPWITWLLFHVLS